MAKCGKKTEVYSRVCGYCRPFLKVNGKGEQIAGYNPGKMSEMKDRKTYKLKEAPNA